MWLDVSMATMFSKGVLAKFGVFKLNFCLVIICYYINISEIPGELSHENMISSHVKITCYFHMWTDHRCYGYIINWVFRSEIEMFWYFTGVYIINSITWSLGDMKFLLSCRKLFHLFAALTCEIFLNTRREILYLRAAM